MQLEKTEVVMEWFFAFLLLFACIAAAIGWLWASIIFIGGAIALVIWTRAHGRKQELQPAIEADELRTRQSLDESGLACGEGVNSHGRDQIPENDVWFKTEDDMLDGGTD